MRKFPVLVLAIVAAPLCACAVVETAASVTGSVVSTTVGVTGDVIGGVSRTVTGGGDDDEDSN